MTDATMIPTISPTEGLELLVTVEGMLFGIGAKGLG